MKIIAVGDIHIKNDNFKEIDKLISELEKIILNENPSFVVLLGDTLHYHEKIFTLCLNKAFELVNRLRKLCPVYMLVGNHDQITSNEYLNSNHWLNSLKEYTNLYIIDKPFSTYIENKLFTFCPFVPPGRFIDALNNLSDWKSSDLIFCHQEFKGCKMGAIISVEGDDWDSSYPQIISGHIHDKQKIGNNIYYTGTPYQTSYGDTDDKTICILEIGGNINIREYELNIQKKKIVYSDIQNISKIKINGEDEVKLTIRGNGEEFKVFKKSKEYKDIIDKGVKIVFKNKEYEKKEYVNSNFLDILNDLITKQKNIHLTNMFHKIFKENN